MTTISYPHLDECIQTTVLDNGLRIYCVPRTDSAKTFAMLAADFGSIDCSFTLDGQKHDVTPGIAHFLAVFDSVTTDMTDYPCCKAKRLSMRRRE